MYQILVLRDSWCLLKSLFNSCLFPHVSWKRSGNLRTRLIYVDISFYNSSGIECAYFRCYWDTGKKRYVVNLVEIRPRLLLLALTSAVLVKINTGQWWKNLTGMPSSVVRSRACEIAYHLTIYICPYKGSNHFIVNSYSGWITCATVYFWVRITEWRYALKSFLISCFF